MARVRKPTLDFGARSSPETGSETQKPIASSRSMAGRSYVFGSMRILGRQPTGLNVLFAQGAWVEFCGCASTGRQGGEFVCAETCVGTVERIRTPQEILRDHLMARDPCDTCDGTGEGPIASEQDCYDCHGAGFLSRSSRRLGEELRWWFEETLRQDLGDRYGAEIRTAADDVDWFGLADCISRSG